MDVGNLMPLVERLEDNIDDLEEILEPLVNGSLNQISTNLPLLDKAKLHVLIAYSLESLLFSYLRINGVKAKEHPVFRELTRVKQYFDKIKALESEPEKRTMTVDKQAASRFIKHGLAGNDKIDLQRAEQEAKERARAKLKAALLAKQQQQQEQQSSASTAQQTTNVGTSSASPSSSAESESESDSESESGDLPSTGEQPTVTTTEQGGDDQTDQPSFIPLGDVGVKSAKKKSKERRQLANAKREARQRRREEQTNSNNGKEKSVAARLAAKKERKKEKMKKKRMQS